MHENCRAWRMLDVYETNHTFYVGIHGHVVFVIGDVNKAIHKYVFSPGLLEWNRNACFIC